MKVSGSVDGMISDLWTVLRTVFALVGARFVSSGVDRGEDRSFYFGRAEEKRAWSPVDWFCSG